MPNSFDCATEIYLNPREFAQQISLSNFLHLTVGLRPNFHRTAPCINIAFNNKKVFSGCIEKEIELNFVLDIETRNKLTIGLSGKAPTDTVIDASGNIIADKYIEVTELQLDKFDLLRDYDFFWQHTKYYNHDSALYEESKSGFWNNADLEISWQDSWLLWYNSKSTKNSAISTEMEFRNATHKHQLVRDVFASAQKLKN
jgi:hypothetical protein